MTLTALPAMATASYSIWGELDADVTASSDTGVGTSIYNSNTTLTPAMAGNGTHTEFTNGSQSAHTDGSFTSTLALFGVAGDGSANGNSMAWYQGHSFMDIVFGNYGEDMGGGTININFAKQFSRVDALTDLTGELAAARFTFEIAWYELGSEAVSLLKVSHEVTAQQGDKQSLETYSLLWPNTDISFHANKSGTLLFYTTLEGTAGASYPETGGGQGGGGVICGNLAACDVSREVPAPTALLLLTLGLAGMGLGRKHRTA
ncbi:MAG: PEP-CTERM sorting domain-containing protein [Gammaproteobacteria bacterium]|nr:PEP-CTERM sorting domain-containing protein [Gammaproteobacteria bacterium]